MDDLRALIDASKCATEGCHNAATVRYESGGIGSPYCAECAAVIQAMWPCCSFCIEPIHAIAALRAKLAEGDG
jgi:hypothetical protein